MLQASVVETRLLDLAVEGRTLGDLSGPLGFLDWLWKV